MCGIVGFFLKRNIHEEDRICIRKMADAIKHRGPNELGLIECQNTILATQRLSIIDLQSNTQPVSNEDRSIFAVFNGEIFNFGELKKELTQKGHVFHSSGDSEVIVHLYEEYGEDFLQYLDGQFAIGLWDSNKKILFLARDPIGICPLYIAQNQDGLYFSSEIKGLLAGSVITPAVNHNAFAQIAYFGTACAPTTFFKGVMALPHAHCMTITTDHTIKLRRYWDITFPRKGEHLAANTDSIIMELQHQIEVAVSSRMQADVPVGNFFSSGIDSGLIAAVMNQISATTSGSKVLSYSIGSSDKRLDESSSAIKNGRLLDIPLNTLVVTGENIAKEFPKFLWHSECPVVSTEAVALMLLAKVASQRSTVILTGEGADEAFGGYLAFRQFKALRGLTQTGLSGFRTLIRPFLRWIYGTDCLLPGENRLNEIREHFGCFPAQAYEFEFYRSTLSRVFTKEYRSHINHKSYWQDLNIDHGQVNNRHWLDQSLYISYQFMLPNYLLGPHGDRIFAANSMEGRYPFLAKDLIQYASSLHPNLKINGFNEKYILRETAKKWLPREIAEKKKRRFMMPMIAPFINKEMTTPLIAECLSDSMLNKYGYFEPSSVRSVINSIHQLPSVRSKPKRYLLNLALGLTLSFVVSTQLWHYQFIEKGNI
jgi:asparagine synthase (glutamine-hydrolysing)